MLTQLAQAVRERRLSAAELVQESIAFVYADGGDRWIDETAPPLVEATVTDDYGNAVRLPSPAVRIVSLDQ